MVGWWEVGWKGVVEGENPREKEGWVVLVKWNPTRRSSWREKTFLTLFTHYKRESLNVRILF